jgi:hypothetical protein
MPGKVSSMMTAPQKGVMHEPNIEIRAGKD